nr:hypothetical protein [Tanacetum cinerariifolium]
MVKFERDHKPKQPGTFNKKDTRTWVPKTDVPCTMPSGILKGSFASILKEGSPSLLNLVLQTTAIVLDDSCSKERDFSMSFMGKVKETKNNVIINESIKIILKGKVHWIRAKELDAWVPKFLSESDLYSLDADTTDLDEGCQKSVKEHMNILNDNEIEMVSESSCMQDNNFIHEEAPNVTRTESPHSEDPFNIYELLQKKKNDVASISKESDPTYPLGFTPANATQKNGEDTVFVNDQVKPIPSNNFYSFCNIDILSGGFILDVMDDLDKVGQTMGYSMDGCLKNISEIIRAQGDNDVIR